MRKRAHVDSGQMAIELVALVPVLLVVAAISANLLAYMGACAVFDRAAAEAVRVEGVSPGYGQYGAASRVGAVEGLLEEAFASNDRVSVDVTSSELSMIGGFEREGAPGLLFSLMPSFRRYTCTMTYRVPFFSGGVFGIGFPTLKHTQSYVVDPFNPGGWM